MIDSHTHLIAEDTDEYISTLVNLMDQNEVRGAVLFGCPGAEEETDSEVEKAVIKYRSRFIPFSSTVDFTWDETLLEVYLRKLDTEFWKGVGEIFLDCTNDEYVFWKDRKEHEQKFLKPVPKEKEENPVYKKIFEYCGNAGLPIMVHCRDIEVMKRALAKFKRTKFIWAHADHGVFHSVIESLMNEVTNLYCDFGVQFRFEGEKWLSGSAEQWLLDKVDGWRKICQLFPKRVVWGTDRFTWDDLDPDNFKMSLDVWQKFAQLLPKDLAFDISEGNILELTKWEW
ncbi:MAG: amidohydrolase family protein [Candidatus Edwardsbacteria bacterium]